MDISGVTSNVVALTTHEPAQSLSYLQEMADYHRQHEAAALQEIANIDRQHTTALAIVERDMQAARDRHAAEMENLAKRGKEADEIAADAKADRQKALEYHRNALKNCPTN